MAVEYPTFISMVEEQAGLPREEARRAVEATLSTLAERISGGEANDVAEQLPPELRPLLRDDEMAQGFSLDEFLERVARREGVDTERAARDARAVFAALSRAVPGEELADLASQLPREFAPLVGEPGQSQPPRQVSADEFLAHVSERAGLDRDGARRATEATLEALADRISGGEADDLAALLPVELRAPLERGKAASNAAARPLTLEAFLQGIAEREGVTPEQALAHARAVFDTLWDVVGEQEMGDVFAQLPDDYALLTGRR
jgi:uncharacterized protein (DUF2267 family)